MRGENKSQDELFSYIPLESRVPQDHPLRRIRTMVDEILKEMRQRLDGLYSHTGRPSIPPEMLLKALFLQVLYTIRSEGQLIEHLRFNLLYRWFVGLAPDDRVWDETVFSKNRDRLLDGEVADFFFEAVISQAHKRKLISQDHFTVDGTLVEAWASLKSFQKKGSSRKPEDKEDPGNPSINFKGEKRKNKTHESKTDPESRLYTKGPGQTAKLSYMGHVLMENRNGLAVDAQVTQAGYWAESDAALDMIKQTPGKHCKTLGADKNYDKEEFCRHLREGRVTPHITQNLHARRFHSNIDRRGTRHLGYEISQRKRKLVEEIFGWLKTIGLIRRPHFRGKRKVGFAFTFALSVYNVLRISNLLAREPT
jgi:transposase